MDKFDSLRKSIRQILEQEDVESPGDLNDLQTQTGQDDVEVKDNLPVVDEKVIDDILYNHKYKIGYVEYNGLMHLLCVLKVYGQNNPLPQDLKDFINLVRDYTLGLFDRQQQGLAASHNISNKNRLVEVDSHSVHDLVKHIKIIIDSFYPLAGKGKKLRHDNVANSIIAANTIISQGLGFFTEVLFYTYVTDFSLWENKEEEFNVLSKVFDLRLKDLKTDIDTYSASLDFAVMYFLLYEVEDKSRESYSNILNNYIDYQQWNSRKEDVDRLANQYSSKYNEPLNHCIEILKKLQGKFKNSKWVTGRKEGKVSMPQYDLWLVEQKENGQEFVYAKIDIKTQLANRTIAPTKSKHKDIGEAKYFGFINFEKTRLPFTNSGFGDFKYTVKYLIIADTDVNKLVKSNINIKGKEYEEIFALGEGDYYQTKEYKAEDLNSNIDPFALVSYSAESPYEVEETSLKKVTTVSLDKLESQGINSNLVKSYFNLGKIYPSPNSSSSTTVGSTAKKEYNEIIKAFKEKLSNKLSEIDVENFPIISLNDSKDKTLSSDFIHGINYLNDKQFLDKIKNNKDKKTVIRKLYINHKLLNTIIEESLKESLEETDLKIPFFMQSDYDRGKQPKDNSPIPDDKIFSILDNFIEPAVKKVLNSYHDIIYKLCKPGSKASPRSTVPLDFIMYFIENNYNEGLHVRLDNEYKKVIKIVSKNNYKEITTESYSQAKSILRSVIKNILAEDDKKSYSGSHPEESYGWSAKEEDFMFDKPGLTTWEKDRQRVKEYLRSMGMLAPKKEKKK